MIRTGSGWASWMAVAACVGSMACSGQSPLSPTSDQDDLSATTVRNDGGIVSAQERPNAVFRTTPADDGEGMIRGGGPLAVEFNLCQSRPAREDDDLKYTFDFDGDGAVDSFGHCRATNVYGGGCTGARVCVSDRRSDGEVCRSYDVCVAGQGNASAATSSLTTTYAGGNSQRGVMFDVSATAATTVNGFDVTFTSAGTTVVEVYSRVGSSFGAESSAAGWTLLGSTTVTSTAAGAPTSVNVGGLSMAPGQTYGIFIFSASQSVQYTNGSNTYVNADFSLLTNCGKGAPGFTGATFAPRQFNGTVYYTVQ